MIFDFNQERVAQSSLDVEDVGNVCIEGVNEEGYFSYIIVKTSFGKTNIFTFGPIIPDLDQLVKNFSFNYTSMTYNQGKIVKLLFAWLNDNKKLTSAKIIEEDEALTALPNFVNCISNSSEE